MILVFGGAYQGKREFAEKRISAENRKRETADFGERMDAGSEESVTRSGEHRRPSVCDCAALENPQEMDFSADILCGLEEFTWACCTEDPEDRIEAADWMREHREQWTDKVLVITDVSCGIVPMDARTRAFREMNGRLMLYLASEAEEVWRVFCGIGKRIK